MKRYSIPDHTDCYVEYTGDIMAMFSPQPMKVVYDSDSFIAVNISREDGQGSSIQLSREPILVGGKYVCTFDLSRPMQLLCDLEDAMDNIAYRQSDFQRHSSGIVISVTDDNRDELFYATIDALYAACDAGEAISATTERRRLFINFPQTISLGVDTTGVATITHGEEQRSYAAEGKMQVQVDLLAFMAEAGFDTSALLQCREDSIDVSWSNSIVDNESSSTASATKRYILVPDLSPAGRGVYLRWMQRDGSIGYWLFGKSKKTFAASNGNAFNRHLAGNPAAPVNKVYRNGARQDYGISETITIGTSNVNDEEYEYLCGLVSSPVVDMLVDGSASTWMRVNVVAGTYEREYPKSGLERIADFELAITLPEKNTIKY